MHCYWLKGQNVCSGALTLRGQLSQICDIYMHLVKLTFGRIAKLSLCLLIGPFLANLHHQIYFIKARRRCLIGLGFPSWKACYRERTVRKMHRFLSNPHPRFLYVYFSPLHSHHKILVYLYWATVVSEPDLRKIGKRVREMAGVEVYRAPGMQAHFWLVHDCILVCIYWKCKPQPTSIVQGDGK